MQCNTDPSYLAAQGLSSTFPKRWMEKVEITDHHWIWKGSTRPCASQKRGHGMIQRQEGENCKIYAHRAAWILFNGPVPDGVMVLHKCPGGTLPYCVNPAHLYLGDGFDNMRDMTREGKNHFSKVKYGQKGESHPLAKITWEIVRQIRLEYTGRKGQQAEMCCKYGIGRPSMSMIVRNLAWIEAGPNQ